MKRNRRILATILAVLLLFQMCPFAVATSTEFPDNYVNMSIEQRKQWMNENSSPVYYDGRLVSKRRDMQYTYTGEAYSEALDSYKRVKFTLETQFTWTVNYLEQTIESYRVTKQEAINYCTVYDIRKELPSYYVTPANVKLFSRAEFIELVGSTTLLHDINLHANGKYSLDRLEFGLSG